MYYKELMIPFFDLQDDNSSLFESENRDLVTNPSSALVD